MGLIIKKCGHGHQLPVNSLVRVLWLDLPRNKSALFNIPHLDIATIEQAGSHFTNEAVH